MDSCVCAYEQVMVLKLALMMKRRGRGKVDVRGGSDARQKRAYLISGSQDEWILARQTPDFQCCKWQAVTATAQAEGQMVASKCRCQ